MTFLVLDSQKNLFTLQQSQLEFEKQMVYNQASWCQREMNYITQVYNSMDSGDGNEPDPSEDPYYIELEQKEEQLQTEISALENQITLMKEMITSNKTQINNNIKSSCSLTLIGG